MKKAYVITEGFFYCDGTTVAVALSKKDAIAWIKNNRDYKGFKRSTDKIYDGQAFFYSDEEGRYVKVGEAIELAGGSK